MKYLVIDIGGTYTKYAVMDEECTFYIKDRIPTVCDTLEHFTDMLAGLYQENEKICEEDGDHIRGIALSSAGVIDSETGFMYNGGSLFCIKNINIVELLRNSAEFRLQWKTTPSVQRWRNCGADHLQDAGMRRP